MAPGDQVSTLRVPIVDDGASRLSGRAGGTRAMAAMHEDAPARVARLMRTGGEIGWGDFTLERLTPSTFVVTVRNSPFAEAYGVADHPVCHLTRGVLEALAASVLAQPMPVVETACAATGAPVCRFETLPDSLAGRA